MGWLNVYAVTCGLGCAYVAHTLLDTPYDWAILWLLVVAVACAILPYLVVRSAVSFPMRRIYRNQSKPPNQEKTNE